MPLGSCHRLEGFGSFPSLCVYLCVLEAELFRMSGLRLFSRICVLPLLLRRFLVRGCRFDTLHAALRLCRMVSESGILHARAQFSTR